MPGLILTVRDSFEFEHSSLWVTRGCKCIKTKTTSKLNICRRSQCQEASRRRGWKAPTIGWPMEGMISCRKQQTFDDPNVFTHFLLANYLK